MTDQQVKSDQFRGRGKAERSALSPEWQQRLCELRERLRARDWTDAERLVLSDVLRQIVRHGEDGTRS